MLVKLPRQCSGQEIVEAFKAAATFQETLESRWEPHEFVSEFQFEPEPTRQIIRSTEIRVSPSYLKKKWILFGEKVWKPDSLLEFTLTPVSLSHYYDEVEVAVRYEYKVDQGGGFRHLVTDPLRPEFEHIRPQLERILGNFCARLQAQCV